MRTALIGILALLCGGCAAPAFDLVSRDPASPWLSGQRWVRTESSRTTVNASFDRTWLDHLIFEVEVTNQTDAPVVVDPGQFSFTLASSDGDLPRALRKRFVAEDPARVQHRLEIASAPDRDLAAAVLGLAAVVAVVALVVNGGDVALPANQAECVSPSADDVPPSAPAGPDPGADSARERERAIHELLHRTELAPGQSVRGEVWLPAAPLRKAVAAGTSGTGHGITATPSREPADHAVTLRMPDALGGQEIDYSVAAW